MHLMSKVLLTELVNTFTDTYELFLKDMRLTDTAVVKLGFYTGALEMVTRHPIPQPEVQSELVEYFERTRKEILGDDDDDLLSSISFTYQYVGRGRQKKRQGDVVVVHVSEDEWGCIS